MTEFFTNFKYIIYIMIIITSSSSNQKNKSRSLAVQLVNRSVSANVYSFGTPLATPASTPPRMRSPRTRSPPNTQSPLPTPKSFNEF